MTADRDAGDAWPSRQRSGDARRSPAPSRPTDPVVPDDDPELADQGWGGSTDTDTERDDELIADRPPHYDR